MILIFLFALLCLLMLIFGAGGVMLYVMLIVARVIGVLASAISGD